VKKVTLRQQSVAHEQQTGCVDALIEAGLAIEIDEAKVDGQRG
jgi:hypothetical protein